ncbi:MAG: histidine phosphatase family protein [Acidimicrobiia bacterium]|nr:histidine phosphatase family protein [Acidimicrobiia bacterium]
MSARIALVRHGEVHNPDHVVYADLDGFGLNARGWAQAAATAARLVELGVAAIVTSPLQRAVETGGAIAASTGMAPTIDERLTEWLLGSRWAGTVWEDLPEVFPGELEAYLEHPTDLPFSPESIDDVARRVEDAVADNVAENGLVVFVSHQDPVQSARIQLTGGALEHLHVSKPGHGSIVLLERRGRAWSELEYWEPDQGLQFPPVEQAPADSP